MKAESRSQGAGRRCLLISARHIRKLELLNSDERGTDIIIDEAHLCTAEQVHFLRRLALSRAAEVSCYGLRRDRQDEPYEGSMLLLAYSDHIRDLDAASPPARREPVPASPRTMPHTIPQKVPDPIPQTDPQKTQNPSVHAAAPAAAHNAAQPSAQGDEEPEISPILLEFLDADGPRMRLRVFRDNRDRLDEHLIETIAAILDIELTEGSLDHRINDIEYCLETIVKYEKERNF